MKPPKNWPPGVLPLRFDLTCAAYYCGLSKIEFLRQVAVGRLPSSELVRGRKLWSTRALQDAVDQCGGRDSDNSTTEEIRRLVDRKLSVSM